MQLPQTEIQERSQRVTAEMELHRSGKRVKIRVENHDAQLGWYVAGSISLPLQQLPLLEQALEAMRTGTLDEASPDNNIIPFPNP
jgi:hypothetical protein